MQFVVLAGGLGTRMRPATDTLPKCLLPVAGRPFVDWQLTWLAERVDRVLLSIGHGGDLVRRHVGDGRRFGVTVDYVDEGDDLRGTAGALRLAADHGALDPTFSVVYGDSYLTLDVTAVEAAYAERGRPVLMTLFRNPGPIEHPNAVFERGLVTRYAKGLLAPPPEMCYVDYGLTVWRREIVETMVGPGEAADLAALLTSLSCAGDLAGYVVEDRFFEIGSPDGLRDLETYLRVARSPMSDTTNGSSGS